MVTTFSLLGGPIWLDPIHDLHFVKELLTSLDLETHQFKTVQRMTGKTIIMSVTYSSYIVKMLTYILLLRREKKTKNITNIHIRNYKHVF